MTNTTKQIRGLALYKQLLVSSRPISWVNTAFPFVAGYLFTTQNIGLYFWVACVYFLIPYNVLIYVINDVFDYESDVRNPRKNSIEGGLLPPYTHRFMLVASALSNVPFLIYLLAQGSAASNGVLIIAVLAALSYSVPPLRFKERPFLDSINSSLHFVLPLIFALTLTGMEPAYWPYIIAFFLWGCASHAFGAVQDITADRKASIHSVATYLGAKQTVRMSAILYVAVLGIVIVLGWPSIIMALPCVLYIAMVVPYWNVTDAKSETANRGWKQFLIINQLSGFLITIILIVTLRS